MNFSVFYHWFTFAFLWQSFGHSTDTRLHW